MHFFRAVPHKRRGDTDQHDVTQLLWELALLVIVFLLLPTA